MEKPKTKLSASKVKMLLSCSWLYYCRYVLKMPSKPNSGASRGLCVHTVLECFVKPRHKKHFDACKNGELTKEVRKLVKKSAIKNNVDTESDIEIIETMICVACKFDFFGMEKTDPVSIEAEKEFSIEFDNYIINGFIDKTITYEDAIRVIDYKSSKSKFSTEELESNIQGMLYSLAIYKLYKIIPNVEFLFLKFSRNPFQRFEKCTEKQLEGFQFFLENLAEYVQGFGEEKAKKSFAARDPKKKWQCGKEGNKPCGQKHYICEYRLPTKYYAILDEKGNVTKTAYNAKDLNGKGVEKIYTGCPAFEKQEEDFF